MSEENQEKKATIVLVDDDVFLLDMYTMKFKNRGYEVKVFSKPQDCIDGLRDGLKPDMILFDVVMPGIDGWMFAKQIQDKELAPETKLVVLSNQSQQDEIEKAKDLKVDGYIIKALSTPSEVVNKVDKYFEK